MTTSIPIDAAADAVLTTSSTSHGSSRPNAAEWCRPTPFRRTPRMSRSCERWSRKLSAGSTSKPLLDIEEACTTLAEKGGAYESERQKILIARTLSDVNGSRLAGSIGPAARSM